MQFLFAHAIAAIALYGMVDPKTIRDYEEVGVGYIHAAVPVKRTLTQKDMNRWIALLGAADSQAQAIQALYEEYVTDRHNSFLDTAMPAYLAKATEAASKLEQHGMNSHEYWVAWQDVSRSAARLMNMAEQLELQFIASLESALTPEQADDLRVLRGRAMRRKCYSMPTGNRWIGLELRDLWDALPKDLVTSDDLLAVHRQLMDYEDDLTSMTQQWTAARLEAGKKVQRWIYDAARDAAVASQTNPAQAWERPANIAQRIRALHMRTLENLLSVLSRDTAELLDAKAKEHIFPEIYPDKSDSAVAQALSAVIHDPHGSADTRELAAAMLEVYRQDHLAICRRLEAFCIEWDDLVELGAGEYQSHELPAALAPILEERATLSRETMRRFNESNAASVHAPDRSGSD